MLPVAAASENPKAADLLRKSQSKKPYGDNIYDALAHLVPALAGE